MPDILTAFGLIAIVLTISALLSGVVERAPLSFPIIFLGLGFALGPHGLNYLRLDSHDQTLEVVATSSLALVLFLDAIKLRFDEIGEDWVLPALALGPGTLLTIGIVAGGAIVLLDASFTQALLFGAILSSTDPVVLRDVVRDDRIPRSVRRALSVEAGTNDIVVLPTVLILIAIANEEAGSVLDWLAFLGKLLILSPVIGAAIGAAGAWLMSEADKRFGIRHEHQALYGIGLVLASYTAATAAGGDGFLAAFAAGFAVTAFNFALCDCFLEYGEVTAEMTMLLAFVLFGAVLSTLFGEIALVSTLVFALLVILVARPLSFGLVLQRAQISPVARLFIAWFGPRGLNSLLLVLLALHAGVARSEWMLAVVGIVVIVSVILHGVTATPLGAWYGNKVSSTTLDEERAGDASGLFRHGQGNVPRMTVGELANKLGSANPPIVLDVRTRSQCDADRTQIPGSIRVYPDDIGRWAVAHDRDQLIVAYCT